MKAVILGVIGLFGGLIVWQMISDRGEAERAPEPTEETAAPVIENIDQLEEQLYRAVGLRLDNDRMYRWSEIETIIAVCGMTPCRNGSTDPASTAILRIALVRNGWYEMNAAAANPTWTHDGFTP